MLDLASSTRVVLGPRRRGALRLHPLVVVVDGHGQRPLGGVLPDDVGAQEVEDLLGLGQFAQADLGTFGELFLDDLVAQVDALIADVDAGSGDELLDLLLALAAERALEQIGGFTNTCHDLVPFDTPRPPG